MYVQFLCGVFIAVNMWLLSCIRFKILLASYRGCQNEVAKKKVKCLDIASVCSL